MGPVQVNVNKQETGAAQDAFGEAARYYDAEQHANPVARWSRRRSLSILKCNFRPGDHLLEVGCGTGEEAIELARWGCTVLATDASPGMVLELESKLAGLTPHHATRVTPMVLPARKLYQLLEGQETGCFDGAYSSFGPLNCEPKLEPIAEALFSLIRPGARLVISLINRYCIWETLWYIARLQPGYAFRRWSGEARATVRANWQDLRIPVFYWSPAEAVAAFAPYFEVERVSGLPWLLPPQYLYGLVTRFPRLFSRLAIIDRRLATYIPAAFVSDHFCLEMTRRDSFVARENAYPARG